MQLSRERITKAALEILAGYGLADVSMRRVASSLSVAPAALYWHIANKQELIAAMGLAIVQPLIDDPLAAYHWIIVLACTVVGVLITLVAMKRWRFRVPYWV